MAYVYRHPKSKNWQAGFRDATGRKYSRSSGVEAHPPARDPKEAAALARDAKKRAELIADSFERAARGELKRESMVRQTILELVKAAGGERIKQESIDEFLKRWIDESEKEGKSPTTITRYAQVRRDFLEFLGDRKRVPVEEIAPSDVKGFMTALAGRGLASKTISNGLKVLRVPFAEAHRLGKIPMNPAAAVKPPQIVSVERKAFTPAELKAIMEATENFENGTEWRTAVMLGYYCAMRLGDATSLKWEAVDFSARTVKFVAEKTRRSRKKIEIPMHPSLEQYLQSIAPRKRKSDALLTPSLRAKPGGRGRLSKAFGKLVKLAGVENLSERTTKADGQGRTVSTKSFHALRHSLASHLANAGVSAEIRMKFTGHSDLAVHAGYTHTEIATLRAALERLPK